MRVVIQRVSQGAVRIPHLEFSQEIRGGMVILLGIASGDTESDARFLAEKCCNLRIFEDSNGKMNVNIQDAGGDMLVISQFTLYAEAQKGNRPSFAAAARPEIAIPLYNSFVGVLKEFLGAHKVKSGIFGEMMSVEIFNDGPVTIIIDSK